MRAATIALLVGLSMSALGALLSGSEAALGALLGTLVSVAVLFGGSIAVDLVAGALPSASLLVALLTYSLQLVILGVFFLAVQRSAEMQGEIERAWIGFAVIAVTVAWMVAQILLTARRRIPAFETRTGGLS